MPLKNSRYCNWLWNYAVLDTKRVATTGTSRGANRGMSCLLPFCFCSWSCSGSFHLWPPPSAPSPYRVSHPALLSNESTVTATNREEQQAALAFCSTLKYNKSTTTGRRQQSSSKDKQTNRPAAQATKATERRHKCCHWWLCPHLLHHCHLELWVIGFLYTTSVHEWQVHPPASPPPLLSPCLLPFCKPWLPSLALWL